MAPQQLEAGQSIGVSKDLARELMKLARVAFRRGLEPVEMQQATIDEPSFAIDGGVTRLAHVGFVVGDPTEPLRTSRPEDETVVGRNMHIVLPAECERRDALAKLNERLWTSVLPKQWWSNIQCYQRPGSDKVGTVSFKMPRSFGTSVLLTAGVFKQNTTVASTGAVEVISDGDGYSLVLLSSPRADCVVSRTFQYGLHLYLDEGALYMQPRDALWLVDIGFRMPGVVISSSRID